MRIRSTKPEFWRSRRIASVSWDARLVLKGLESYVDDNGVGKDDIALIASDVFPRDLARESPGTLRRVSEAITELHHAALVWRYDAQNTELLFLSWWEEVQYINKPNRGRFPRPDGTFDYKESKIGGDFQQSPGNPGKPPVGSEEQGIRGTEEIQDSGLNRQYLTAQAEDDADIDPTLKAVCVAFEHHGLDLPPICAPEVVQFIDARRRRGCDPPRVPTRYYPDAIDGSWPEVEKFALEKGLTA